jgi:predicted porin
MKKTLIALAALAATGAFAQSTVTLSGTMDIGLENVNQYASQIQTSRNGTTNFTLAGTEDIGGGLKARFFVSTSFDSSFSNAAATDKQDGAYAIPAAPTAPASATQIGNNGMFVALDGGFGSVIAGRPKSVIYDMAQIANGTKGVSGFAGTSTVSFANVYTANALQYVSPTFGGFSAALEYNAAEALDATSGASLGLKYANGPLTLTAVQSNQKSTVAIPAATVDYSAKVSQFAASYDFNVAKVFLTTQNEIQSTTAAQVLGVTVPVGAAGQVWAQYGSKVKAHGDTQTIIGLGYKHNLSKRTQLYVNYGSRNDAAVTGAAATAGSNAGYGLGLTHNF